MNIKGNAKWKKMSRKTVEIAVNMIRGITHSGLF